MDAYGKLNDTDHLCLTGLSQLCLLNYDGMDPTSFDMGTSCFLVFNDGSSRDLMSLTGTVPVSYRGKECFSDFYCCYYCSHSSVLECDRMGHEKLLVHFCLVLPTLGFVYLLLFSCALSSLINLALV